MSKAQKNNQGRWRQVILPSLGLFTSLGTLLCCALPALLVTFGMGAALAGFVGAMPWITVVSQHKIIVFVVAGFLLVLAAFMQWYTRHAPCPVDPVQAKICQRSRIISRIILVVSIAIYLVGFFFAFVPVYKFL